MSLSALKASKMERTLGAIVQSGAVAGEINSKQTISAGAGAASSQTVAAPAITPLFAGQMYVSAGMTTSGSNSVVVTFVVKSGATIIAQKRVTSDATNGLASAQFGLYDPVLQTGSTIYEIVATPASGNVAVANKEGSCTVTESGA
jgi:hypothetical protein